MPFARFGRTAACSRGDGKKIWRMAAHEGHLGRLAVRAYLVAAASWPTMSGRSSLMWRLSVTSKFPGCDWSITSRAPPGSPASRSTRTENRKTMPCSFRATRLSTRASAPSSINATSRRLSLSTCHRLPPRKRLALDFDLFDGFIGLDLAPDRAPEWHAIAKAYL